MRRRSPDKEAPIDGTSTQSVRARRTPRDERQLVILLALVGGFAATLGGAAPTGVFLIDVIYVGGAGAGLTLAGGRSRRTAWLLSSVGALWLAPGLLGRVIVLLAIGLGIYSARTQRRRAVGAAIGALLAYTLGDLGTGSFQGATTLFAAAISVPMVASAVLLLPANRRRGLGVALSLWAAVVAAASVVFALSALLALSDVGDGVNAANRAFELASDGDEEAAAADFDLAASHFESVRGKVSGFWTLPARLVPIVGQHARAVQVVAAEGVSLTETAADTARAVDPDDLHLAGGRIDLSLIDDLVPTFDRAERALDRAHERISDAHSEWLVGPIAGRLSDLQDELDHARPAAHTAALAMREIPTMLGGDGKVRWFVALTTPAEARGLGGLLGNWVLIEANDGHVAIIDSGRNEDINLALRAADAELTGSPQYVERWGKYTPEVFFQDVTLSPDLPMVAEVAVDLFEIATGMGAEGVVVLDPYAIAAILDLTGPVQTTDLRLGSEGVVPFLLVDQYNLYDNDEARVAVLEQLVAGAFTKFVTLELPGPSVLSATLDPVVDQGRLGMWWHENNGPQRFLEDIGVDGAFPESGEGDLLAVVHQNAGQNKIDTYLERTIDYELVIDDGQAEATISLTLANRVPSLDLPLSVIGNNDQGYPVGTNVALVTVHTALNLQSARLDGETVPVERAVAFEHDAITLEIEIPAFERRVFEIVVAGPLDATIENYRLTLAHQPLVINDTISATVTIDDVTIRLAARLQLDRDMVIGPGKS